MNKAFLLLFWPASPVRGTAAVQSPSGHRIAAAENAFVHLVVVSSPSPSVEVSISNQVRAVVPRRGISPRMELSPATIRC